MNQLTATHKPSNAYYSHADDNLRLTPADPYRELVRAIIKRAYWDSLGKTGNSGHKTDEERYRIMQDARRFFQDGRCHHWLECLDVDPEKVGMLGLG